MAEILPPDDLTPDGARDLLLAMADEQVKESARELLQ